MNWPTSAPLPSAPLGQSVRLRHSPRYRFAGVKLWKLPTKVLPLLLRLVCLFAQSAVIAHGFGANFNADHALAWSPSIGWTNWRPDETGGAQIGEYVCSGYLYGANVGWIHLGSGTPANGIQYSNTSATDYGINHDPSGNLRGLAYGANIGWINFEAMGAPQVHLRTGRLSGSVYGANIGWINLSDASFFLQVDSIASGADSDNDGIPDAWELLYAGNLTTFGIGTDSDHDGQSDLEEALADTNPLDPSDQLRILRFSFAPDRLSFQLDWTARPTRDYFLELRPEFSPDTAWSESGLGSLMTKDPILSLTLTNNPGLFQGYYRIRAVRPLAR